MNRTKITASTDRDVTISFMSADTDDLITMHIWAPEPGASGMSYVRFNDDKQLCNGLSSRGETLALYEGTKLVDLVRSQYRAMRAAERRNIARRGYA